MKLVIILVLLPLSLLAGTPDVKPDRPFHHWSFDAEISPLWRVSDTTNLDYGILAGTFSLRTPYHFRLQPTSGSSLVLRANFTLLTEAFLRGPESYYFGFSASPSIEYWFPSNRTHLFFSAGGGLGVLDSSDTPGGQGQDLTLNWFIKTGVRFSLGDRLSLTTGVFFQHLSNGGMAERNPGLDTLGPTLGFSWKL